MSVIFDALIGSASINTHDDGPIPSVIDMAMADLTKRCNNLIMSAPSDTDDELSVMLRGLLNEKNNERARIRSELEESAELCISILDKTRRGNS